MEMPSEADVSIDRTIIYSENLFVQFCLTTKSILNLFFLFQYFQRAIMLKYFHEQMLSRGQKFHNTEMTEEQRGIIVKARRSMDLSSMTDTVAKLR